MHGLLKRRGLVRVNGCAPALSKEGHFCFLAINTVLVTSMYWALSLDQALFLSALQASPYLIPEAVWTPTPSTKPQPKVTRNPSVVGHSWHYWLVAMSESAHHGKLEVPGRGCWKGPAGGFEPVLGDLGRAQGSGALLWIRCCQGVGIFL